MKKQNVRIAKELVRLAKDLIEDRNAGMFDKKAGMFDKTAGVEELSEEEFKKLWKVGKLIPDTSKFTFQDLLNGRGQKNNQGKWNARFYADFDPKERNCNIEIHIDQNDEEVFRDNSTLSVSVDKNVAEYLKNVDDGDEEKLKELWEKIKPTFVNWFKEIESKADDVWAAMHK